MEGPFAEHLNLVTWHIEFASAILAYGLSILVVYYLGKLVKILLRHLMVRIRRVQ